MTYRNSSETTAAVSVVVFFALIFIAGAIGWIWNIVKLFAVVNEPLTGMEIARGVGVFLAPLGAILGFL